MKLNLGCGENWKELYPDYVGLDLLNFGQEYVADVRKGIPGKWSEIMANHLLEHLDQDELKDLFSNAYKALKKGGIFKFAVPHMNKDKAWILSHKTFWNEETVRFIEKDGDYYGFGKWRVLDLVTNQRQDIHAVLQKI